MRNVQVTRDVRKFLEKKERKLSKVCVCATISTTIEKIIEQRRKKRRKIVYVNYDSDSSSNIFANNSN